MKNKSRIDMRITLQQGFTLVELLVASGIFIVVIIILTSLSGQFIFTQRRDVAEHDLLEDLRLVLETFNREARTAYGDTFLSARPDGTSVIFRNQNGSCVNWRLEDQRLERAELSFDAACEPVSFASAGVVYTPLTGSGVLVTSALFDVEPSEVREFLSCEGDLTAEEKVARGCNPPRGDQSSDEKDEDEEGDQSAEEKEEVLRPALISQGFITLSLQAQAANQILIPLNLQSTVVSRQVIPFPTN